MSIMGLSFMFIPLLLIAVIAVIVVAGSRIESREGGEEMIKNIYIYLVLFATLMMTIGGSVAAFMAVADIYAPVAYHQSFEDYKRWGVDREVRQDGVEVTPTEEELRKRYDAMIQTEQDRQVMRAKNNLIKSFGWIVIPFPIFIYFQRKLRTAS